MASADVVMCYEIASTVGSTAVRGAQESFRGHNSAPERIRCRLLNDAVCIKRGSDSMSDPTSAG